ncbi:hypothetical protein [Propylenella binzhouense]|uniref:DUF4034 domain-containing protein n=1 Tax=Propylenella binzhouense TaxID=2555902 RepID=A0A964WSW0_9HYPH|nr:hypothetical protein [Propylenella binzhouense]MYZ47301.1 hypothetical protein [Propylenella binzhouense]
MRGAPFLLLGFLILPVAAASAATPEPASEAELAKTRDEVMELFGSVLERYREQFRPHLKTLQQRDPTRTKRLVAQCASREAKGVFADSDASAADKFAAIAEAVEALRQEIGSRDNADTIVNSCVGLTVASGHDWAGAIWTAYLNERSGAARGGDLLAAYYGSGALGATDMAMAKKTLAGAKRTLKTTDTEAILAKLDVLDGTAYVYALYDEAFEQRMAQAKKELSTESARSKQLFANFVEWCPAMSDKEHADRLRQGQTDWEVVTSASQSVIGQQAMSIMRDKKNDASLAECFNALLVGKEYRKALVYAVALSYLAEGWASVSAVLLGSGKALGRRDLGRAAYELRSVPNDYPGYQWAQKMLEATQAALEANGG